MLCYTNAFTLTIEVLRSLQFPINHQLQQDQNQVVHPREFAPNVSHPSALGSRLSCASAMYCLSPAKMLKKTCEDLLEEDGISRYTFLMDDEL